MSSSKGVCSDPRMNVGAMPKSASGPGVSGHEAEAAELEGPRRPSTQAAFQASRAESWRCLRLTVSTP